MKRPSTDDVKSTTLNSFRRLKGLPNNHRAKKFFPMRNIIKKVKTHGMNFFTSCLTSCMSSPDVKTSIKPVYKSFKSDICKSRNRYILDVSMHELMSVFSNIDMEYLKTIVDEGKRSSFNFLLNLTWDEFLTCILKYNHDVYNLLREVDSPIKLTSNDVKKYYEYIYQGIDYKQRTKTDGEYIDLYHQLKRVNNSNQDLNDFFQCFEEL
jgi:hypothetical protein